MDTPEGKKALSHDWFVAGISFIAAVVVNLVIFSYGQGRQEHRIETVETKMETLHKDLQLARDRIERALVREELTALKTPANVVPIVAASD